MSREYSIFGWMFQCGGGVGGGGPDDDLEISGSVGSILIN